MKVIMRPAVTLDGFIADLDGECYSWVDPDDEARYEKALLQSGCELVGRKTYEQYIDNYSARTEVTTFVLTSQDTFIDTDKVKFVSGSPQEICNTIRDYGFSELLFCGGGELNGFIASAGLIDEIIMSIHSIILGSGIPLFGSYKPRLNLKLLSTEQSTNGVVRNHYKVIR